MWASGDPFCSIFKQRAQRNPGLSVAVALYAEKTACFLGPEKNSTHIWQLQDRGIGRAYKCKVRNLQEQWMERKMHRKRLPKLSAWERRVLVAQWVNFNSQCSTE